MDKLEWIRAEYDQSDEKDIPLFTAKLNYKDLVENPNASATIAKVVTISEAFAVVPKEEVFAISETKTYDRLLDAFNKGRMDWVQDNITTLVAGNVMSTETAKKLAQLISQTEENPNTKILASPANLAGFDVIYTNEVEEALGLNNNEPNE